MVLVEIGPAGVAAFPSQVAISGSCAFADAINVVLHALLKAHLEIAAREVSRARLGLNDARCQQGGRQRNSHHDNASLFESATFAHVLVECQMRRRASCHDLVVLAAELRKTVARLTFEDKASLGLIPERQESGPRHEARSKAMLGGAALLSVALTQ